VLDVAEAGFERVGLAAITATTSCVIAATIAARWAAGSTAKTCSVTAALAEITYATARTAAATTATLPACASA
jgi:hypothetical protein